MKKNEEQLKISEELLERRAQRRLHRGLKMTSIIMVVSMVTLLFPIVPLGHASDICLHVPTEQTLSVPSEDVTVSSPVMYVQLIEESAPVISDALLADTFVIQEHTNRDGVAVEMLDVETFELCEEILYATRGAYVYDEPSSEANIIGSLKYADKVRRTGRGSAWSLIEFVNENDEVLSGYVVSSLMTQDVLATPTPVPTETPTPTPEPKEKKKTPTPTEAPKKEETKSTEETKSEPTPTPVPEITEEAMSGTYYSAGEVNVRKGPGTSYSVIRKLSRNDSVNVVAKTSNGWYKLDDGGYVRADLLSAEPIQTEESKPTNTPEPTKTPDKPKETTSNEDTSETEAPSETTPTPTPAPVKRDIPDPGSCDLLTYCRAFIGIPYVYTGADLNGLDCSGFVMYVYAHYYGISLPHQSASIASMGNDVTNQELKAGDVICHDYNGDGTVDHVSLYCGEGVVIHASTSRGGIVEDWIPMSAVVCVRRFI